MQIHANVNGHDIDDERLRPFPSTFKRKRRWAAKVYQCHAHFNFAIYRSFVEAPLEAIAGRWGLIIATPSRHFFTR